MDGFSVIMPTYNQSVFLMRAVNSLLNQAFKKWELIIVNDGSTDNTELYIQDVLANVENVRYIKNKKNIGLGCSINKALDSAKYDYISYLPSDDFYFENHLEELYKIFHTSSDAVLVFTGMRYDTNDSLKATNDTETFTVRKGYSLQLVQTAHKKTKDRWVERSEFISEDLFYTFWNKLTPLGNFYALKKITCYWTSHPFQRHKIMSEKYGGNLNFYRGFYHVKTPLKIRVSNYKFVNEEISFSKFINVKRKAKKNGLKILIVGELGYNPERICGIEEAGHTLYGLWLDRPTYSHTNIGPFPFGNIKHINPNNYKEQVKKISPDIIYALLNFAVVDLAYEIMKSFPNIPFVWHFKEGPKLCIDLGKWEKLLNLYSLSDGKIYINEESKSWFEQFMPTSILKTSKIMILDGDLPKIDYFTGGFSKKLSSCKGGVHTVVTGRMIGMPLSDLLILAKNNIHVHVYTESYHENWQGVMDKIKTTIPEHFHIHPHCNSSQWVSELSQYDIGWLHCFNSNNKGNIQLASWVDLNIPARLSTLAAAGLPVIQKNNSNHIVAMQNIVQKYNFGVLFDNANDLSAKLKNKRLLNELTNNIINNRMKFSFDYHVPALVDFFKQIIETKKNNEKRL